MEETLLFAVIKSTCRRISFPFSSIGVACYLSKLSFVRGMIPRFSGMVSIISFGCAGLFCVRWSENSKLLGGLRGMCLRFGICVVSGGGIRYSYSGDDNFLGISIYFSPLSVPMSSLITFLFSLIQVTFIPSFI